ncbi:hypothetical protein [Agromyces larvae]|uniref:EF-hand domain-containing protein n=1 Tax=Agromyces larvae TaxID=2929802 RepID=A0ABY4BU33_9MICO|nr:hypothetical protein [Agromyces larvae]UOE42723.1 hypothetical protein MTO99_11025 [Agromyces larvae]
MMTTRICGVALTAVLVLPVLSGCTAADALFLAGAETAPKATAAANPAPIKGDADGDGELSEFEKQVLARHAPRDIILHDGTVVVLTPGRPLPQLIIDQIVADAVPGAAQTQTVDEFAPMAGRRSILEVASTYADQIGRPVVIVYQDLGVWNTISSLDESGGAEFVGNSDKDAMVAAASDWAATHDAYVVVVG